jgi:hypothetical protein
MIMGEIENAENVRPKVFKLSELIELLKRVKLGCKPSDELPELCQRVQRGKKGARACMRALKMVRSLLAKSEDMFFVLCCCHALKVIPFKISKDDAYLVHTRSLVPDYVHLSEVAEILTESSDEGKVYSAEYVREFLWAPVRPLNESLAEDAFAAVKGRAIEDKCTEDQMKRLMTQGEKVKVLGRAYGDRFPQDHPTFDVVVYNMLKGSKFDRSSSFEGLLKTTVAVKDIADSCIVRVILKSLNVLTENKPPLPIIGMALATDGPLKACLENDLLDEFSKVLLGKWECKHQGKDLILDGPNDSWDARVAIHLNKKPNRVLRNDIALAHEVAINMADNTIGEFLLKQWQKDKDWEKFRDLLDRAIKPIVYSTNGVGSNIFWFQILGHLRKVLITEDSLCLHENVLKGIFELPGHYSPLTPAVDEPSEAKLWQLLLADFRDKGSRYRNAVQGDSELVLGGLKASGGDKGEMIGYLKNCGIASARGFAKFIRDSRGSICDKATEERVWETLIDFCEKNNEYDVLVKIYEALLAPGVPRALYYLRTEALGMLVAGITAGRISWYRVAKRAARNQARGFAKKRILAKASG